jgi:hypothetical protein
MVTFNYTQPASRHVPDGIAQALMRHWYVPPVRPRTLAARGAQGVNKQEWVGILCPLDVPSDKPPGGAEGHLTVIPSALAARKLDSLIGMPLNISVDLTDHDKTSVIGTVAKSWIANGNLMVSGYLWDKNFAPQVAMVQANVGRLGMSYEISSCHIVQASAPVWTLDDFEFTGLAVLRRDHAAYAGSAFDAAAAR